MTACTNHGGKARRVVTAALVGVLSVGTVPMVALATGADTTDGIETLAVDWSTDAEITSATDGKGGAAGTKDVVFAINSGKYLVPTAIDGVAIDDTYTVTYTGGSTTNQGTTNPDSFVGLVPGWSYKADGVPEFVYSGTLTADQAAAYFSGTLTGSADEPVSVKKDVYTVTVSKGSGSVSADFKLADATQDVTYSVKGSVVYNGVDQADTIKFVDQDGADVTSELVEWKLADGSNVTEVKNAGSYNAIFSNGEVVTVEVKALDLSSATVTIPDLDIDDVPAGQNGYFYNSDVLGAAKVNGASASFLKVSARSGAYGYTSGPNTVTITGTDADVAAGNVTGSATVEFTVYDNLVASEVRYGRDDYDDSSNPLTLWLEDGDTFDASKISVADTTTNPDTVYSGDQLEVTYTKADGTAVDASALSNPGNYIVHVRVVPFQDFKTDDWQGGSKDFKVVVNASSLDANKSAGFYFDGELAGNGTTVLFDGTDQLDKLEVVVKDAEGNVMEQGTDYKLKVTKGGKEVKEAVDYGTYTVEIVPVTFTFDNAPADYDFDLNVEQIEVTLEDLDLAYTGSALETPATYKVKDVDGMYVKDDEGNDVIAELPTDVYNVVSVKRNGKTVSEVKDATTATTPYVVTIALSDAAKSNYKIVGASNFEVEVTEYGHFVDVNPGAWYAQAVEEAYHWRYINGIGGTEVFMPEAEITRADAVGIIFNMAGGTAEDDFKFDETGGYITGFEDVDGHAYYAKAIAWAKAAGVVNGHGGNFRPNDDITREEFATMLANYAKASGKSIATDGSALAELPDASGVSSWAQESVAWAVENEVMGNGGFVAAQSNITRAEVAAMAVNYQPEGLNGWRP